jgi:hypothetical protein
MSDFQCIDSTASASPTGRSTVIEKQLDEKDINENNNSCNEDKDNTNSNEETVTATKVHTVCETEDCANVGIVNLQDMCDLESKEFFPNMKVFVENCETNDLTDAVSHIFTNVPDKKHFESTDNDSKNMVQRFENLLMLRMFKRLKLLEKQSIDYRMEIDECNKYQKMYSNDPCMAALVRIVNLEKENASSRTENETENENENEKEQNDKYMNLLQKTITPYKITKELLTYELLHYEPEERIKFEENNLEQTAFKIRDDINRFNLIVKPYLEDNWKVNIRDTLNFVVPKNKIILSNTIDPVDEYNDSLSMHIDMTMNYIKRCYKVATLKYAIVEDNKFNIIWLLISIGYYVNDKPKASSLSLTIDELKQKSKNTSKIEYKVENKKEEKKQTTQTNQTQQTHLKCNKQHKRH